MDRSRHSLDLTAALVEELIKRSGVAAPNEEGRDKRPVISLIPGENAAAIASAVEILAARGELFVRGGVLIRKIESRERRVQGLRLPGEGAADAQALIRDDMQPIIVPVSADWLRGYLDQVARFEKPFRSMQNKVVDCPRDLALAVLALGEWSRIPSLRAIARAPFLRADGSVCARHGYDQESGVLLVASGEFPAVPKHPAREDALSALEKLLAPFAEVAFAEPIHQSAFVAFILTLASRHLTPTSPAFTFISPGAGTGKGLIADCAMLIVHGATATKRSYPNDPDEFRKVLHAVSLAGDQFILFDNAPAGCAIGNDVLNLYVTADAVGDRTLGSSLARRIPNNAVIGFTGINIGARADFVRRTLAVRIDPNCEHPERRSFRNPDLRAFVHRNRAPLLSAVLTILRAFVLAGAPAPKRPLLGSFEAWDQIVCGPLNWLGMPDALLTQTDMRRDDPDATHAVALFKALADAFPAGQFKVADVRERIEPGRPGGSRLGGALGEAIDDACGSVERLGFWLRSHAGQIHAGRKLERLKSTQAQAHWRITEIGAPRRILIRRKEN